MCSSDLEQYESPRELIQTKRKIVLLIIKCYKDNILIGIKLDKDGDYLYVATMHEVQESKIVRRLHSGRIKEVITECEKTALKTEKIILTKKKLNSISFYRK